MTMKIKTKNDRRVRIALRQRKRISGTPERPRLRVFRSVSHIYAQVIDDLNGTPWPRRPHDEMHVTRVKAIHDLTWRGVQDRCLPPDRPVPCERPLIEAQSRVGTVRAGLIAPRSVG